MAGDSFLCSLLTTGEEPVCRWVRDGTGAIKKKITKAWPELPPPYEYFTVL